ncbi:hypothetical protein ACODT5_01475 [Streptomyces sp. 5.8]|uniref:hypothetical protein n=1 Tax=Streptomyces sp. 5.8 TaxID=3406571 RepID=UPI003BB65113
MNTPTLTTHAPALSVGPPQLALRPRAVHRRPRPADPLPAPDLRALQARRTALNHAARAQPGPMHVVLYALTVPGRAASGDLAAARGHAESQRLTVVGAPLVDTLDTVDAAHGSDDPLLRRAYARALQMLADPASPVRGVVAVSRTAITPADRLYEHQLTWYAHHRAGLWLVRDETGI